MAKRTRKRTVHLDGSPVSLRISAYMESNLRRVQGACYHDKSKADIVRAYIERGIAADLAALATNPQV